MHESDYFMYLVGIRRGKKEKTIVSFFPHTGLQGFGEGSFLILILLKNRRLQCPQVLQKSVPNHFCFGFIEIFPFSKLNF